ncbi:Membrane-bound O-acyltransferase gup1-like protein [Drosera capensis]
MGRSWWGGRGELAFIVVYAVFFYVFVIHRSLQLSHDYHGVLRGLRSGWLANRLNDVSDAQWRNFRQNLPILTAVFGAFTAVASSLRSYYHLKASGMAVVWLLISLVYLLYLHGACVIFIISIASFNFVLVKDIPLPLLVTLRMISFGYDYHWSYQQTRFDQEKHIRSCSVCKSGRNCYFHLQERSLQGDKFLFTMYLCYLVYAPLYIAGPIVSYNAFASQLDQPQNTHSTRDVVFYGLRWIFALFLVELMTHFCYYNAFALSDIWKQLPAVDVFIIGYGVLNFMWLKFLLIWRYFRFWSLVNGLDSPENMPKCINNCYNLESFWKNWHASYNKWLVRYIYIPLGGSRTKVLNVWIVFTFVAIWHDLEWKLLSWAWLTCVFFVPEMLFKSAANTFQVESAVGKFVFRELSAVAGAVTITCLMIANLVGFVVGPSGINLLFSRFLRKEGVPVLMGMLFTFYIGTKLMFHIRDASQSKG